MEPNFYEILEIAPDASPQLVERAYRIARATYQPASTATYSIFSDEENASLLERIEEAYTVLSDARLRREYDARLRREGRVPSVLPRSSPVSSAPMRAAPALRSARMEIEFDRADQPTDGLFDGPALRRVRIERGIELEEIAKTTKINELYLQFMEANRYADLPARVYLRGFLREVAKCLKLDPTAVVESYMSRYDEVQSRS